MADHSVWSSESPYVVGSLRENYSSNLAQINFRSNNFTWIEDLMHLRIEFDAYAAVGLFNIFYEEKEYDFLNEMKFLKVLVFGMLH